MITFEDLSNKFLNVIDGMKKHSHFKEKCSIWTFHFYKVDVQVAIEYYEDKLDTTYELMVSIPSHHHFETAETYFDPTDITEEEVKDLILELFQEVLSQILIKLYKYEEEQERFEKEFNFYDSILKEVQQLRDIKHNAHNRRNIKLKI